MKPSTLVPALLLLSLVGCKSGGEHMNDHWNESSIVPRMSRVMLGYDAEKDDSYRDFAWERKADINMTLRRHFMNHNPDNPNQEDLPSRFGPRPRNSLLPQPGYYIHVEGLILGLASLGAGGPYIPLPIDSILGTFEGPVDGGPSGMEEFMEGINETFGASVGTVTSSFAHKWIEPTFGAPVTRVHRLLD